jgi:NTP pyrophosphatase (non-canonical NTP hydrolase)
MENELTALVARLRAFSDARDWAQFHSPKNLACALSVEVSELLEQFQWMKEDDSRLLSPEKLAAVESEVMDVFCYLLMISDKLDIDLIKSTNKKIESNESRYPVDKAKGRSNKYNEL